MLLHKFVLVLGSAIIMAVVPLHSAASIERELTPEEITAVNEISAYNSEISSMAGRFIQVDSQGNRAEGVFFLTRPDQIRFKYAPPSRQEILSVGKGFYVVDRKEKTKVAYPQDKIPLRQFLTDRVDLLNTNISEIILTDTLLAVSIVDDTEIGRIEITLIFDLETKDLTQWTLTEPNGNDLTFSIYDVIKNAEIPSSYYYIDPTYSSGQSR